MAEALEDADAQAVGDLMYRISVWRAPGRAWLDEFAQRHRAGTPMVDLIREFYRSRTMLDYGRIALGGAFTGDPREFVQRFYREFLLRDASPQEMEACMQRLGAGDNRDHLVRTVLGSDEAVCRVAERLLRISRTREKYNIYGGRTKDLGAHRSVF